MHSIVMEESNNKLNDTDRRLDLAVETVTMQPKRLVESITVQCA